ncbi:hypothetical protein V6N11_077218 [Hibiscus sabdariffa]|uniref:Subtilisin-like protease SBT5.3 n=1 Tax=Hibiscus sabdariffa TaxID=183260 RepID=A0ABR2TCH2_9ROSI
MVFSLLQMPGFADKKSYVVYLGGHSPASVDPETVTETHYDFLGSFLGSRDDAHQAIFYSYTRHINGFAANLDDEVASEVASETPFSVLILSSNSIELMLSESNAGHPEVVSVFMNKGRNLHTTRSWEFLGLEQKGVVPSTSIWNTARYGEETIIGNLDTGAWPESKSFSDDGYGPIPSKWKGICQNHKDPLFHCNRKLIGGRYFNKGYAAAVGRKLNSSFDTPRDNDGHGTHTLSTAGGGNSGPADGTISNLAPWQITVGASTMDREFPSTVVLGNSRRYKGQSLSEKVLPHRKLLPLISAADAKAANASVETALLCQAGGIDPEKATGKVLVCLRGQNSRVDKGLQASLAGAVGMILANDILSGNEILADPHVLPATHINYTDGLAVFTYINSTKNPTAYITPVTTQIGTKPAPFMAAFSSKGPNTITPEILKPDITAPGVSVIAAFTEAAGPTNEDFDKRRVQFNSISGTSMSCPHVSGIVGLLKTLYPNWSPAAIKSAIMTTATTWDNLNEPILNASNIEAGPFSYGAGHVQPNLAMDPGLVYDLVTTDYLNFLCTLGYNETLISLFSEDPYKCPPTPIDLTSFNYPSITIPNLAGSITVTRTVKNVGSPGTYRAQLRRPMGISVYVKPRKLKFKKLGEEKTFSVTLKVKNAHAVKEYVFGKLIWYDNIHYVRSPIVVKAV